MTHALIADDLVNESKNVFDSAHLCRSVWLLTNCLPVAPHIMDIVASIIPIERLARIKVNTGIFKTQRMRVPKIIQFDIFCFRLAVWIGRSDGNGLVGASTAGQRPCASARNS